MRTNYGGNLMTYNEARAALDTGERVRHQGRACIVTGTGPRRKPVRDLNTGEWRCVGDWYYGADIIDRNGRASQVRVSELQTEAEYLESIKGGERNAES